MFECGEIPLTVRVLHEDELLVVVDKPTGVATAPGGGLDPAETLQAQVTAYIGSKAYLVHRLDRETSGVIVFAKSPEAHRELSRQFEERQVTKRYLALVDGHVDGDAGEITLPLREFGSGRVGVDPSGRAARTSWKVRERLERADLLEVSTESGRRHQIRVHLYAIGHPILGDTRYGTERPVGGANRLMLHALELTLPAAGEQPLVLRAEPAADFWAIVASRRAGAVMTRKS